MIENKPIIIKPSIIKRRINQQDCVYKVLSEIITVVRKGYTIGVHTTVPDSILDNVSLFVARLKHVLHTISVTDDRGYVNQLMYDLPIVSWFLKRSGIYDEQCRQAEEDVSITTGANVLGYYVILLLVLRFCIILEVTVSREMGVYDNDLIADVTILKNQVLKLLHPVILKRLASKGLSVTLNTFSGFDTEYELKSSVTMENRLLSCQLAVSTNAYLIVPVRVLTPLTAIDLGCNGKLGVFGTPLLENLDFTINAIKSNTTRPQDEFLEDFKKFLDRKVACGEMRVVDLSPSSRMYIFSTDKVETLIRFVPEYSSDNLVSDSDDLLRGDHIEYLRTLFRLLDEVSGRQVRSVNTQGILSSVSKVSSRMSYSVDNIKINISITRVLYVCAHESAADLPMLSDFEILKYELSILRRYFVTMGSPIIKDHWKTKVHFRETSLLAPAGHQALASLGKIYGEEYHKVDIGKYRDGNMSELMIESRELFIRYAIQDSLITLKHSMSMEQFYTGLGFKGVPLTLSTVSKAFVKNRWVDMGYKGYQDGDGYLLGNVGTLLTPKNIRSVNTAKYITAYLGAYRGGRNETFMYGVEILKDNKVFIDYDLVSCYTSVMSILGDPDYTKGRRITEKELKEFSNDDMIYNYIVLEVFFTFDARLKYPNIPTLVDKDIDIYPSKGRSIITGCEYLVAIKQGASITLIEGVIIPFKSKSEIVVGPSAMALTIIETEATKGLLRHDSQKPYQDIMKDLQYLRRTYPKKSLYNLLYKEIGNSIYGQCSMGLSDKKSFNVRTNTYVKIEGGDLSNPVIASYITGFTRALVGECLGNIAKLKGRVVSVTTDGFITDVVDLEGKLNKMCNTQLLKAYQKVRTYLTTDVCGGGDSTALEIKTIEREGITS